MPTENRSSNTEMVSVTRYLAEEINAALINHGHVALPRGLQEAMNAPCPPPHPEPIAWMVGTAFWWTKEEAERDAAAMNLPVIGLGPMTDIAPAEHHQGEPVAWRFVEPGDEHNGYKQRVRVTLEKPSAVRARLGCEPLYTHADPGEVERLRSIERAYSLREALLEQVKGERDRMIARTLELADQLAEREALLRERREEDGPAQFLQRDEKDWATRVDAALSASAEPSAPVERDERAASL